VQLETFDYLQLAAVALVAVELVVAVAPVSSLNTQLPHHLQLQVDQRIQ
jgi:hypothetical protein